MVFQVGVLRIVLERLVQQQRRFPEHLVPAIGRPQKVLKPGSILKAGLHDPSTCSSDMRSKSNILSDSICCKHSLVKGPVKAGRMRRC